MTRPATRAYDQITIRVGPEVGRRLRVLAKAQGVSVSRVVDETLRTGVGLGPDDGKPRAIGNGLDWLVGTLSDVDAREILEATKVHERIDEDFWAGSATPKAPKKRPRTKKAR